MSKNMAVINDEHEVINIIYCEDAEPETSHLITYTNENPARIGGHYLEGYFYTPQPYPSWTRETGNWIAPVEYPTDGNRYSWNEESLSWIAFD